MKSPEYLTAQLLIAAGLVYAPPLNANAPSSRFTIFKNSFPDTPHNIISVSKNGLNRSSGRLMDGTPIRHPGLQFRARAMNMDDCYEKLKAVYDYVNTISRYSLTVLTETYRIDNISTVSEPYFIGLGQDDQRPSYVFDAHISYTLIGA